jgi:hypothetical protein
MNDKIMNGFVAGTISGLIVMLLDWFLVNSLKFGSVMFSHFSGTITYGKFPQSLVEYVFANLVALLFLSSMGILFTILNGNKITNYFIFKAVLFSEIAWFLVYGIFVLFKVPGLVKISLSSAMENTIVDFVYGLLLGYTLIWLKKRERQII